MRTFHVPKIGAAQKPQLLALQEWADSLCTGMLVVFTADRTDVHMYASATAYMNASPDDCTCSLPCET